MVDLLNLDDVYHRHRDVDVQRDVSFVDLVKAEGRNLLVVVALATKEIDLRDN